MKLKILAVSGDIPEYLLAVIYFQSTPVRKQIQEPEH